ncbi:RNA-binding S4 domain-containing protein [Azotosporobacter soli]|uniref:RNA-binding S4 domain-containing protein n=1 Tax=Azotosporobacter soli TaxID=3055040 RepID=UPI0031FE635D
MEKIIINTPDIQLDQFLKWAGVVESGGQVKILIEAGIIMVNGQLATQKRKKLIPGDVVSIQEEGTWLVAAE